MKKYVLLIMAFLVLISLSSMGLTQDNETNTTTDETIENITVVPEISINITPIDNEIKMDETAKFLVYISGEFDKLTRFKVYSPAVEWDVPESVMKVYPANDEASLTLEIKPLHVSTAGVYGIPINIRNLETDELNKKTIYVALRSGMVSAGMSPSVRIDIEMPDTVDPKGELVLGVEFINKNLLNLSNLRFEITSSLDEINTRQNLDDLKPLSKISLELPFKLDPLEAAGENTLTVDLYQNEKVIKSETKRFNIAALTPPFIESVSVDSFLLKTKKDIEYTSESNVQDVQTIRLETNWLERLFTSTDAEVDIIKEDGKVYYSFDLELAPQESKTVTLVTNYRILAYILIILTLVVVFYYKTKSPLIIKKTLTQLGTEEGGVSEMKIMLEINNRGKKDIKNVTVRDPIPNLVEVKKEFAEGTLKPSKFLKSKEKGIMLEWKIDELAPGENRLIGYNIKSRLSIIGVFKLPRAKIFFIKKGKEQVAYSNPVSVSA